MLLTSKHLLFLLAAFSVGTRLYGQAPVAPSLSVFDYLTQEEGAKIQLDLDLTALLQNRKKAEYLTAVLTDNAGKAFDVSVRTRGKFRRRRCEIPPIKLKFAKSGLREAQLDTMNEIKLVLPCAGQEADEELIVREYLIYRMFESLSPDYCVRARLIRLHLKDSAKKRPQRMLAMLVEHEEQVSGRLRCGVFKEWGIKTEQLHTEQAALAVLFEYLVGNTDWEIASSRNMMLLQPPNGEKVRPVPYDFDFSGFVAAPYASPNSECNIRTVRDRCLMDPGISAEAFQQALRTILEAKPQLYTICRNKHLSSTGYDDVVKYLDSFFQALVASKEIPARMEFSVK